MQQQIYLRSPNINISDPIPTGGEYGINQSSPYWILQTSSYIGIKLTIHVLLLIIILIGNITAIAVVKSTQLLHRPTGWFILNLAITNFLSGLFLSPIIIITTATASRWSLGDGMCQWVGFVNSTLFTESIITIAMMSVDSYLAIVKPFRYHKWITHNRTLAMLIYSWLQSIVVSILPLIGWSRYTYHPSEAMCFVDIFVGTTFTFFLFGISFICPVIIIVILYILVLRVAVKKVGDMPLMTINQPPPEEKGRRFSLMFRQRQQIRRSKSKLKAVANIFIILGPFLACWLPYIIINIYRLVSNDKKFSPIALSIISTMTILNSAINPILYPRYSKNYRIGLGRLISLYCHPKCLPCYVREYALERSLSFVSEYHHRRLSMRQFDEQNLLKNVDNVRAAAIRHIAVNPLLGRSGSIHPVADDDPTLSTTCSSNTVNGMSKSPTTASVKSQS
ncbi:Beta-2 adrenergic receptor [Trichoplax sp. H2]|nr:Beta-2 adrenergic receptor [Trichoplax sp. H2]|eukprot:RDD43039.1 Beta-2 adrenergic receptor [Trichoplax sp. H2]